jgi:hypothetical protein
MSSKIGVWILISLTAGLPCFSREIIHLSNGFSMEGKSHVRIEDKLVLTTATGTVELPVSEISQVEIVPDPVSLPVKASINVGVPQNTADFVGLAAASQGNAPEFIRFVQCVARVESGLQKNAVSSKGAVGLMQLMPDTAKDLGVSATDPKQNAEGGAKYLRELLQLYGNDSALALAAYNAGPGAVQKYGGIPPYSETRQYVRKVLREYGKSDGAAQTRLGETAYSASAYTR